MVGVVEEFAYVLHQGDGDVISNHFWMGSVKVCIGANKDTSIVDRKVSDVVDEAKPLSLTEQIELDIRDVESRYGFSSFGEQRA